jgi:hypothetical protein
MHFILIQKHYSTVAIPPTPSGSLGRLVGASLGKVMDHEMCTVIRSAKPDEAFCA